MARRQIRPKRNPQYEFQSMEECEESPKYDGLHRIEVTDWPPRPKGDDPHPATSALCTRCGCHCLVTADNDPERTGIEVAIVKREPRTARAPESEPVPAA